MPRVKPLTPLQAETRAWLKEDDQFRGEIGRFQGINKLSVAEIAKAIGMSPPTLYKRMKRPADLTREEERRLAMLFRSYGLTYREER